LKVLGSLRYVTVNRPPPPEPPPAPTFVAESVDPEQAAAIASASDRAVIRSEVFPKDASSLTILKPDFIPVTIPTL